MKFHLLDIPVPLKGYVHSFWELEKEGDDASKEFKTMADGCPGILFQHSDKGRFLQNDKPLAPLFLYGPATRPNLMQLSGECSTLGLFFAPHALKTVFGLNASELTNTCIDLNSLREAHSFRLLEKLLNSTSKEDQMHILSSFVFSQIQRHEGKSSESVYYALSQILSSNGNVSLDKITTGLRMSERSLERKFKEHVGLSPKLFSRICRFQASLQQLQQQSYEKLSEIAFENEYADQSHFIRSFKEFAGLSPYQFQKQVGSIAGLSSVL